MEIAHKGIFTIKKDTIYVLMYILIMLIASINDVLTLIAIFLIFLFTVFFNYSSTKSKSILIPKIILASILFQNFSIGLGAKLGNNGSNKLSLVTQIPTIIIAISFIYTFINSKLKNIDIIFIIFILVCLTYFFIGEGSFLIKLTYMRNFTIFYMVFFVAKFYIDNVSKQKEFINYFLRISIISVIFGLVGIILGASFYRNIGVLEVYKAKNYTAYRDGLPGNFKTLFFGRWVNRMASLYLEPVNFSYFIALSTLLAFYEKKKFLLFVFFISTVLTFGKGGIFVLVGTIGCYFFQKTLSKSKKKIVRFFILLGGIVSLLILVKIIDTYFENDFGTYNHFYGMKTGLEEVIKSPFGHGLGTAGNLLKTAENNTQEISETGLVNLWYQIGIFGLLLFSYLFLYTGKESFYKYSKTNDNISLICSYIPFILLLVSVYQENTYATQCITPYMLIIGSNSGFNLGKEDLAFK